MGRVSRDKMVRGVAWASVANWGSQLLSFGVYTGLARLLTPQTFGLVAIAGVYIAFVQVFVTQGFGAAIIQRHELQEEHLDSAFWMAMATAALFCVLSLVLASPIAHIFQEPRIAPVIRWLSVSFVFYALSAVPTAMLNRDVNFRALAVRGLAATGAGGAVGLAMAYCGWGVWSLVGQQLVNAILGCLCLWWAVPWRPRFHVSPKHLRDLYTFSLSITGNDILWFFSQKSDQTVVGYGFGSLALGPYSLASRINTLMYEAIVGPSQSVIFPAFSKLQTEPVKLTGALCKYCEVSSFVALPVFAGMAVVAPELVPWLFGTRWTAAVPILQALAFYEAMRAVLSFVHPFMLAKGQAGLFLFLSVIQSSLTVAGCFAAVHWGPGAIALSMGLSLFLFAAVFLGMGERCLDIRTRPLLKAFAYPVGSSLLMLAAVALLREVLTKSLTSASTLVVCVTAGAVVYVSTALLLRPDLVKTIYEMMDSLYRRRGSATVVLSEALPEE
jgi:O-antigen/teichoic acid export membrane protein